MKLKTTTLKFLLLSFVVLAITSGCQSDVTGKDSKNNAVPTPKAFTAKEAQIRDEKLRGENEAVPEPVIFEDYKTITWDDLKKVTFEEKFYEEVDSYLLFPSFSEEVENLKGKKVAIKGYVIPLSPGRYVLSANPFASCFFCGNAGPESVMELFLQDTTAVYFSDEFRGFAGTLELNDSDIDHMNYILKDAFATKEEKD